MPEKKSRQTGSIKNIVFDLGGVLLEWNEEKILHKVFPRDKEVRDIVRRTVFEHPDWKELDRGTLELEEAIPRFCRRNGRTGQEMAALMKEVREILSPLPESVSLLRNLHNMQIPLYCISNMHKHAWERIRGWDLFRNFRGMAISCLIHKIKPKPEIYRHLLESYSLKPEETLFIDDMPSNILGAEKAGMKGILFTSANECAENLSAVIQTEIHLK